jgi:D-tyrosyl-tRNA(Tyr) deacylase
MRMVCQRVLEAKVTVNDNPVGSIGRGLLVYLGVGEGDTIICEFFQTRRAR